MKVLWYRGYGSDKIWGFTSTPSGDFIFWGRRGSQYSFMEATEKEALTKYKKKQREGYSVVDDLDTIEKDFEKKISRQLLIRSLTR